MIKVLGVCLGNGTLEEENGRPRITAVEKCLNSWRSRSLSYYGKVLIVNALALSRVWYVASLLPMPDWVSSELNTLVFPFFLLANVTWLPEMWSVTLLVKEDLALCPSDTRRRRSGSDVTLRLLMRGPT